MLCEPHASPLGSSAVSLGSVHHTCSDLLPRALEFLPLLVAKFPSLPQTSLNHVEHTPCDLVTPKVTKNRRRKPRLRLEAGAGDTRAAGPGACGAAGPWNLSANSHTLCSSWTWDPSNTDILAHRWSLPQPPAEHLEPSLGPLTPHCQPCSPTGQPLTPRKTQR